MGRTYAIFGVVRFSHSLHGHIVIVDIITRLSLMGISDYLDG